MGEKIEVEADEKVAGVVWQTYGLCAAFEVLGGEKPKSTLPGFALAVALIEKELADTRANLSGAVYRCAAKAGHNIAECASIHTTIKNNKPMLEIEMYDLVDKAAE